MGARDRRTPPPPLDTDEEKGKGAAKKWCEQGQGERRTPRLEGHGRRGRQQRKGRSPPGWIRMRRKGRSSVSRDKGREGKGWTPPPPWRNMVEGGG